MPCEIFYWPSTKLRPHESKPFTNQSQFTRFEPSELANKFSRSCAYRMTPCLLWEVALGQWRKGTDLFLQLARIVSQQLSNAHFAWIGGSARDVLEIEHDVRLAGLAQKVRVTGAVAKTADYFGAADVFVLTSREDPYPLVCLEAAALSKPIVCFAGAGGMPEFVEEDCGFVVPYLDLAAMAEGIVCPAGFAGTPRHYGCGRTPQSNRAARYRRHRSPYYGNH